VEHARKILEQAGYEVLVSTPPALAAARLDHSSKPGWVSGVLD